MIESPSTNHGVENPWDSLTERQKEIARLRLQGYPNMQISETLQIEPATVRTHLRAICRKLGTEHLREALAILRLFFDK